MTAMRPSLPFQARSTMPETDRSFMRGGIYIVCLRACIGTIGVGFGDKPDPQFSAIHADGLDEVALAGAWFTPMGERPCVGHISKIRPVPVAKSPEQRTWAG
jgi:hypothetical protein